MTEAPLPPMCPARPVATGAAAELLAAAAAAVGQDPPEDGPALWSLAYLPTEVMRSVLHACDPHTLEAAAASCRCDCLQLGASLRRVHSALHAPIPAQGVAPAGC